jgi:hypothetical protein
MKVVDRFPIDAYAYETFASINIDVMDGYNAKLGSGSGFIGKFGKEYYLITALHVLLGASSSEQLTMSIGVAKFINANCFIMGQNQEGKYLQNRPILIDLYLENGNRSWRQMFDWDVAAINITDKVNGQGAAPIAIDLSEVTLNRDEDGKLLNVSADEDLPRVGSDVFIVGYPGNMKYLTDGRAPLWKRASIASEPHLKLDGRPIFLVDTQGAGGLSGSPVLYNGPTLVSPSGEIRSCSYERGRFRLIGVYCGREGYASDAISLSMGRVFKLSAIQSAIMEPGDAQD